MVGRLKHQGTVRMTITRSTAYDQTLFAQNYPEGMENHYWSRARNWTIERMLERAVQMGISTSHAPILEIGCGRGIVIDYLSGRGYSINGVELGEVQPIPRVRDKVRAGIAAADLPAEERAGINTILLLDVIEHVEDDRAFVRSIRAAFPNCRCLIVTVPARPEAWSRWDEHYGHFRRYTPDHLRTTLACIGTCKETRYFFRSLYLAAMFLRVWGRRRRVQVKSPRHTAVHAAVAAALKAETLLLPRFPIPGLSLAAICAVT